MQLELVPGNTTKNRRFLHFVQQGGDLTRIRSQIFCVPSVLNFRELSKGLSSVDPSVPSLCLLRIQRGGKSTRRFAFALDLNSKASPLILTPKVEKGLGSLDPSSFALGDDAGNSRANSDEDP